jgi:hypothetical protein
VILKAAEFLRDTLDGKPTAAPPVTDPRRLARIILTNRDAPAAEPGVHGHARAV